MDCLKIVSYNCRSVKNSQRDVIELCNKNDLIFIQEHWLPLQDLGYLNSLHTDFYSFSSSPLDLREGIIVGRPYGGLGILYRKNLAGKVKLIESSDDRYMCIELITDSGKILFINCYMPYFDNGRNYELYIDILHRINAVVLDNNYTDVMFLGDFNCNIGTVLFGELEIFCSEFNYFISDVDILGAASNNYTYISDCTKECRWLDHVLSSEFIHRSILEVNILHNFILSDHKPLQILLNVEFLPKVNIEPVIENVFNINWQLLNNAQIEGYTQRTKVLLNNICIPESIKYLSEANCHIAAEDISDYYENIITCLIEASGPFSIVNKTVLNNDNNYKIPGWNDYVKEYHKKARFWYKIWKECDSPRSGEIFNIMCKTRLKFKYAYRFCKKNEKQITMEKIGLNCTKNKKEFWKQIRQQNNSSNVLPSQIEGISGLENIANFWKDTFKDVLTSVPRSIQPNYNILPFNNIMTVTPNSISIAIQCLNQSNSIGPDNIMLDHIKYSHESLHVHLSILFSAMFRYGCLPNKFMNVCLIPLIKNKCGDLSSKSNYRPISISTVLSKVFEKLILIKCEGLFDTSHNQFAFKKNHSTDHCIYVLKQTLCDYVGCDTPVFTCFMDISKAFDRVDNDKLIEILIDRKLPIFIVDVLKYWFCNQLFYVKWHNYLSESFSPTCGLRQGSLLSPVLFTVFLDNLSSLLNMSKVGCNFFGQTVNHLCYADDLVLFAPSVKALQLLLYECEKFAKISNINFNLNKTKCMNFLPKSFKGEISQVFLNNVKVSYTSSIKYLGVTFTSDLTDDKEIKQQCRAICAKSNSLIRKFSNCNFSVKNELFKSFCTNIYGSALWVNYKKSSYNSIQLCYNNAYRFLHRYPKFCSASNMFVVAGIPSFKELIRRRQCQLMNSVLNSKNCIIISVSGGCLSLSSLWLLWRRNVYINE